MDSVCVRRYGLWGRDGRIGSRRYGLSLVLNQVIHLSTQYSISRTATNLDRQIRTSSTIFRLGSRLTILRKYILCRGLFKHINLHVLLRIFSGGVFHNVITTNSAITYGLHFYSAPLLPDAVRSIVHALFTDHFTTNSSNLPFFRVLLRFLPRWSIAIGSGYKTDDKGL